MIRAWTWAARFSDRRPLRQGGGGLGGAGGLALPSPSPPAQLPNRALHGEPPAEGTGGEGTRVPSTNQTEPPATRAQGKQALPLQPVRWAPPHSSVAQEPGADACFCHHGSAGLWKPHTMRSREAEIGGRAGAGAPRGRRKRLQNDEGPQEGRQPPGTHFPSIRRPLPRLRPAEIKGRNHISFPNKRKPRARARENT